MEQFPNPNQLIKFKGNEYIFIFMDFGGKCKIKKSALPGKGKVLRDVDIKDIEFTPSIQK
jgi:hypothetical protein